MKLYYRYADEFSEEMTTLIEVQTGGGLQKIRMFSLRGAHLIGMLSRAERAKEFRHWILDVIDRHKKEMTTLTTEYHQAIAMLEIGSATASVYGKGLSQWKYQKRDTMERIGHIKQQMQPDLFLPA